MKKLFFLSLSMICGAAFVIHADLVSDLIQLDNDLNQLRGKLPPEKLPRPKSPTPAPGTFAQQLRGTLSGLRGGRTGTGEKPSGVDKALTVPEENSAAVAVGPIVTKITSVTLPTIITQLQSRFENETLNQQQVEDLMKLTKQFVKTSAITDPKRIKELNELIDEMLNADPLLILHAVEIYRHLKIQGDPYGYNLMADNYKELTDALESIKNLIAGGGAVYQGICDDMDTILAFFVELDGEVDDAKLKTNDPNAQKFVQQIEGYRERVKQLLQQNLADWKRVLEAKCKGRRRIDIDQYLMMLQPEEPHAYCSLRGDYFPFINDLNRIKKEIGNYNASQMRWEKTFIKRHALHLMGAFVRNVLSPICDYCFSADLGLSSGGQTFSPGDFPAMAGFETRRFKTLDADVAQIVGSAVSREQKRDKLIFEPITEINRFLEELKAAGLPEVELNRALKHAEIIKFIADKGCDQARSQYGQQGY